MSTRKISAEISEELLAAVQSILGTATLEDTVEEALREVVRAKALREEIHALWRMEGMDLGDAEAMSGAWRS